MKKILAAVLALVITTTALAQKKADWKEMHAFHGVMSKTFHPAEEGNLQPTRDSATVLVTKAKAWQKSTVPAGYNGEVTKPILKDLVAQCEAIKKAVKAKKNDEELKGLISKAHDIFHEIMEKCRNEQH